MCNTNDRSYIKGSSFIISDRKMASQLTIVHETSLPEEMQRLYNHFHKFVKNQTNSILLRRFIDKLRIRINNKFNHALFNEITHLTIDRK